MSDTVNWVAVGMFAASQEITLAGQFKAVALIGIFPNGLMMLCATSLTGSIVF